MEQEPISDSQDQTSGTGESREEITTSSQPSQETSEHTENVDDVAQDFDDKVKIEDEKYYESKPEEEKPIDWDTLNNWPKASFPTDSEEKKSVAEDLKKKSKYFDNMTSDEFTKMMTDLQKENPEEFRKIMMIGNELQKLCQKNDIEGFSTKFLEASNTNVLFWHVTKAFKKALDLFHKEIVDYILNTLEIDITHESFKFILHYFIKRCMGLIDKPEEQKHAKDILTLLIDARRGLIEVDEVDISHSDITPLQLASFFGLSEIVHKLLEEKANINSSDSTGKTPLKLLKIRAQKIKYDRNFELYAKLEELAKFMEDLGAVDNTKTETS